MSLTFLHFFILKIIHISKFFVCTVPLTLLYILTSIPVFKQNQEKQQESLSIQKQAQSILR